MRGFGRSLVLLGILTGMSAIPAVAAECALKRFVSVDTLTTQDGRMVVPVKIGDSERYLMLDTGGSISGLTQPAARELGLSSQASNVGLIGIGGAVSRRYAVLPSFTLGSVVSKAVKFMILPGNAPMSPDNRLAGTIAPNPDIDLELDFVGRKLGLFSADHCDGQGVYWPATAIAAVPMRVARLGHIVIPVTLDGKDMDAALDTGSSDTILNLSVARDRFDIRMDAPDMEPIGQLGQNASSTIYRRRFNTLSFAGITVANPVMNLMPDQMSQRLPNARRTGSLIREADRGLPDLILGMSVLSETHIYVAYREKKVYITSAATQPSP
jgi:predicted aspartyl protease